MVRQYLSFLVALGAFVGMPALAESNGGTHEYYSVNGARLYVESVGHGPPILFLHGGLMFFDNAYAKQRDYFAGQHQVIGIDQRGHGHSSDGPWQLSYQLMADDTWAQSVVIDPDDLKKIQSPVLVVAGDHDFTSIEETTEIFRGLPHAQLFLVPGTGHGTFRDRPQLVNLAVAEFLNPPDGKGPVQ